MNPGANSQNGRFSEATPEGSETQPSEKPSRIPATKRPDAAAS